MVSEAALTFTPESPTEPTYPVAPDPLSKSDPVLEEPPWEEPPWFPWLEPSLGFRLPPCILINSSLVRTGMPLMTSREFPDMICFHSASVTQVSAVNEIFGGVNRLGEEVSPQYSLMYSS